jgi:glycosyltransferase involved in cell wall biosynthesis
MKILFILELYYPNIGGIEKLFKSLAETLAAQDHDVSVITTRFRKDLPIKENLNGVKIRRLKYSSRFMFSFFGVFSMMKEARDCDIIHTTSYNAAFPARIAGWLSGKKVIITFHEVWGKLWFRLPFINIVSKILFYTYEQFILRLGFYRYVAVSDYTRQCLVRSRIKEKRLLRIYNGIDYSSYDVAKYSPPGNFVFTYFGRLGISKGLDIILDVSEDFLKKHPEAQLKLIIPRTPAILFKKSVLYSMWYNCESKTIF